MNYRRLYVATAVIYTAFMLTAAGTAHAVTAENLFPDKIDGMMTKGEYVRKGTIGATLKNIMALDLMLAEPGHEAEIDAILKDQRPLGRGLYVLDVFQLQPVDIWLGDVSRQGRVLVAVVTMQESPELINDQVLKRLRQILPEAHPLVAKEIEKLLA